MKTTLLSFALLSLGSISTFAASESDFERGFKAGISASKSENIYICKIEYASINTNYSKTAVGLSRGNALMNLYQACSEDHHPRSYNAQVCVEAIKSDKAECTKH